MADITQFLESMNRRDQMQDMSAKIYCYLNNIQLDFEASTIYDIELVGSKIDPILWDVVGDSIDDSITFVLLIHFHQQCQGTKATQNA